MLVAINAAVQALFQQHAAVSAQVEAALLGSTLTEAERADVLTLQAQLGSAEDVLEEACYTANAVADPS